MHLCHVFIPSSTEIKAKIEQKRLKMNAQQNIKQNIATATLLREYLKEKHLDTALKIFC
jgi:hypothetical protein